MMKSQAVLEMEIDENALDEEWVEQPSLYFRYASMVADARRDLDQAKANLDLTKAEVDKERCVGCLLCKHLCPVWDCIGTEEIDGVNRGGMHQDAMQFVR